MARAGELGKKIIFIGFGSIIIPDPEKMTRVVTEAVGRAGVFAVIAKGWSDRGAATAKVETTQHDYIFNIESIPHDWLFPRIHAAVHHGGAGTTGASLRGEVFLFAVFLYSCSADLTLSPCYGTIAGLPTIIKPFFGDQYFYADRVSTLGIGSAVREMTVDHLAAAIIIAVTDPRQITRAKLAGEAMRKEDGVGKAIECIYRDLEYSKSLIPPLLSSQLPTSELRGGQGRRRSWAQRSSSSGVGDSREDLENEDWDVISRDGDTSTRSSPTQDRRLF